jgi:hypothetical protein
MGSHLSGKQVGAYATVGILPQHKNTGGPAVKQPNPKQDSPPPTRREFAKALAALAAVPLVAENARPDEAEDTLSGTARSLSTIAELRYGKLLTEPQRKKVQRSIRSQLRSAERLHKFKFGNGDEPAFIFQADGP